MTFKQRYESFLIEIFILFDQLAKLTRKYLVPASVFVYCVLAHYVVPAFTIPYYFLKVREQRLATA